MDRPKILIVDDAPDNLEVLYHALKDEAEVFGETSGTEALETVRSSRPDLILLDIMMPGMDGYEVCAELKKDADTAHIPIIFITARTDAESETRALSAGGADFISKPFNVEVVRARVRLQLELARHRRRLEELVQARTRELVAARDAAEVANQAKSAVLATLKQAEEELRRHRDYLEVLVRERTVELETVNAQLVNEINERKRAEVDLFRQHELQRVLLSAIPAYVYVKDAHSIYLVGNKRFSELSGIAENEIYGKTDYDFFSQEDADSFRADDAAIIATGEAKLNYEVMGTGPKGNTIWYSTSKSPFYGPSGEAAGLVGICLDITERKRAEEERLQMEQRLYQMRKAESLARMAGAIAHNFNNMLGVVIGNLDLAQDDAPDGSALQTCIQEAMAASQRAANISRFMLTYLGQTAGKPEPIDPAAAVREACSLLRPSLPKNVRVKAETPFQGGIIKADRAHLAQILTNLLANAVEAIGEQEGEIALSLDTVRALDIQERKLFPPDWKPRAEEYVGISLADTGCGIEPDQLDSIFDPFFSTRFPGRGLGLAVVLGLLRTVDGAVGVESLPGRGTTFKLFFPLLEQARPLSPKEKALVSGPAAGGGLVLVVDDESMVRNVAEAMLKRKLGYEVVTARDGFEAVAVFKERKEEIDVVLLDLSMPGMDGWETLSALRALRPDIPVVLCSGYDEAHATKGSHAEKPQHFLSKPYGSDALREAIQAALK